MRIKEAVYYLLNKHEDTGWKNVPNKSAATLNYRIKDGILYLRGYSNTNSYTGGQWHVIGTLPEGARPAETMYGSISTRDGKTGECQIWTTGEIYIQYNQTTSWLSLSFATPLRGGVS